MSPLIQFDSVQKSYGHVKIIDNLQLDIARGEFLSLLGPSGSGKTTTLMMLAGFEPVSGGRILMDGKRIDDLPSHKRGMGVVFQNYALFPHMSVAANVAFPLEMRKTPKSEIKSRVDTALERVKLGQFGDRRPSQLSGGQQQRVALARALVFEPQLILLDEPLGALDKNLREEMQFELRALHQKLGLTFVFVTHDQGEALTMSDRIAVFQSGRIAQIGSPEDIYDRPENLFVAGFVGETNMLEGEIRRDGAPVVQIGKELRLPIAPGTELPAGAKRAHVSLRPERIYLADHGHDIHVPARVSDVVYQGDHIRLNLSVGAVDLVARMPRGRDRLSPGDSVTIGFDSATCRTFPA